MRPHGKYARVNENSTDAFAVCDRCGFVRNMSDLVWQVDWAGVSIVNERILVCKDRCFNSLQEQNRSIVLPPDPMPVLNARVENFAYEEQTPIIAQFAGAQPPWGAGPEMILCDETGEIAFVLQYLTSS